MRSFVMTWLLLATRLCLAAPGPQTPPAAGAAPAAAEARPPVPTPAAPAALDPKALAELGLEHARSRDALLAAEARLSLLLEQVFRSRLVVRLRGEVGPPFRLERIELDLDGTLAYEKDFDRAASTEAVTLFDGFLPPGRHAVALRLQARGPDDPEGTLPGYQAGAGMAVHLRENADCEVTFEAEQDGDTPGRDAAREQAPDGNWQTEIRVSYQTRAR